jgi:hypothetical protein
MERIKRSGSELLTAESADLQGEAISVALFVDRDLVVIPTD